MVEKHEFFEGLYADTLVRRAELRKQFLELLKTAPVLVGINLYFIANIENAMSLCAGVFDGYSLFVYIVCLLTALFIALLVKCFFYPPKYAIRPPPKEINAYWENLSRYRLEHNIEKDPFQHFQESRLEQTVSDANRNDYLNVKQNELKNFAGIAFIGILCCYTVLILLLIMRAYNG